MMELKVNLDLFGIRINEVRSRPLIVDVAAYFLGTIIVFCILPYHNTYIRVCLCFGMAISLKSVLDIKKVWSKSKNNARISCVLKERVSPVVGLLLLIFIISFLKREEVFYIHLKNLNKAPPEKMFLIPPKQNEWIIVDDKIAINHFCSLVKNSKLIKFKTKSRDIYKIRFSDSLNKVINLDIRVPKTNTSDLLVYKYNGRYLFAEILIPNGNKWLQNVLP